MPHGGEGGKGPGRNPRMPFPGHRSETLRPRRERQADASKRSSWHGQRPIHPKLGGRKEGKGSKPEAGLAEEAVHGESGLVPCHQLIGILSISR